jgi:ribonuclease J
MWPDIDRAGLWTGAQAISSQWEGYLEEERGEKLKADLANRQVPLRVIHTSGHASVADLQRLAKAINPKTLVPIHTFEGHRFSEFFENVACRRDGEWWSV